MSENVCVCVCECGMGHTWHSHIAASCMSDHPDLSLWINILLYKKKNPLCPCKVIPSHVIIPWIVMEQIAKCWKMERKRWAFSEENLFCHTENTPADVLKNWCLPLFCFQCHLHPQKLAGDEQPTVVLRNFWMTVEIFKAEWGKFQVWC